LETVINIKKYLPGFYSSDKAVGKKVVWAMQGIPPELLSAFDLTVEWPENFATLSAAQGMATVFIEAAASDGFSMDLCSYSMNGLGYAKRQMESGGGFPSEMPRERGAIMSPDFLLASGYACDPRLKWFQSVATRYKDVPVFTTDPCCPPFDADVHNPKIAAHYLKMLRRDTAGLVAFLEANTGEKLDLDKLRGILKNSVETEKLLFETNQMCKALPCPVSAVDYFSQILVQMFLIGEEEALVFARAMRDEVKERVTNGVGVIADEKHRFIWMGIPPWFNLGVFNYLEDMGVTFPLILTYNIGQPGELNLDDPLEALVQRSWQKVVWHHCNGSESLPEACNPAPAFITVGTELIRRWIKEFKIDGAILHCTRSCRAIATGQIFHKALFAEEGVKSLIFESDMADPRQWNDARVIGQIESYLETLEVTE
jgi:benzoyl-CoA reductase/2-hydroxyglutaryl-CoA dehydratase subunit BcrC/BadD/HgdB